MKHQLKAGLVMVAMAAASVLPTAAQSGNDLPAAPSWNKDPGTSSRIGVKGKAPYATPGYKQWLQQRLRDPLSTKDTEEEAYAKSVVFAGLFGGGGLVAAPDESKRFQVVRPGARLGRIEIGEMGDTKLAFTLDGRPFNKLGPASQLPVCPDALAAYLVQVGQQVDSVKPYTSGKLTIDIASNGYAVDAQGNIFVERAVPFAPLPAGFKTIRADLSYGPERKTGVDLILVDLQ